MHPHFNAMNMNIFPITSASPHYDSVENLLLSAFPADERRDTLLQRQYADDNPLFTVYAAFDDDKFVGCFTLWSFEEFSFVEHLAVNTELRGKGYGTRILHYIKEIAKLPLLLEIEVPCSEAQAMRKHFYEKNGFEKVDKFYFQPPYRVGEKCIVMHLMRYGKTDVASLEEYDAKFNAYTAKIYTEVYSFTEGEAVAEMEYKSE